MKRPTTKHYTELGHSCRKGRGRIIGDRGFKATSKQTNKQTNKQKTNLESISNSM